jgi:LysR family nitrogen assimilation transcriptional regulator
MIRTLMEEGLVDVGVMASSERSPGSYHMEPLLTEQLFLVGPADAELDASRPATIAGLGEVALILPGRPNLIRIQVERAIREAGRQYRNAVEAETLSLCLELTRRGVGYTVMPASALFGLSQRDDRLSVAPVEGLELTWSLCANRARGHSVAVRSVAAALREFVGARIGSRYSGAG